MTPADIVRYGFAIALAVGFIGVAAAIVRALWREAE